jgi:predicted transposase YdaD
MQTTIKKGFIQEAFENGEAIGEARGEARGETRGKSIGRLEGRVNTILDILSDKFGQVPNDIVDALNQRTDEIALRSLAVHAANCLSLDDFSADL